MKYNKLGFAMCTLAFAGLLTSCKNYEDIQHYTNKVFISTSGFVNEVRIAEDDIDMQRSVVVGIAKPEPYDINVTFKAAPNLLGTYREAYYDADVLLLPNAHYDLSDVTTTIEAGRVKSSVLELDFVNLDQLDLDARYVLPITIASTNGLDVLESARTVYYVFKEASLVNVVMDMNENWAWPEWTDPDLVNGLTTFTMETLVYGHAFKNEISTVMGIEDTFLLRIGDTPIAKNQVQVAYATKNPVTGDTDRRNITDISMKLQTNRWYHIAVTFDNGEVKIYIDGKEKATGDATEIGLTSVDFGIPHSDEDNNKPRCFWVGYSYDNKRYLNGMISETRIWNKALTEDEINAPNHFYGVEPDTEGLIVYWKFDEGEGDKVKDHTVNGNDLTLKSKPKWTPVELPKKNNH